jgi:sulfite reductase beta subunit-like hemoprotein
VIVVNIESNEGPKDGKPGTEGARVLARKAKQTAVEQNKRESHHLRGTLVEALQSPESGLSEVDQRVAKFHGIYQQEDRDRRSKLRTSGASGSARHEKQSNFMVRIKIPAGQLTADQYLGLDQLSEEVVYNQSLRITTRQNIQLHGLLKGHLKPAIQRVDEVLLSTLCGCGDVERNVVAPPAPLVRGGYRDLHALAAEISDAMVPATNAYHEIWLDGERVDPQSEKETIYGEQYLPRKFKTGLALPEDNSVGVYDQDLGLIGIVEGDELRGVNVLVGGGSGLTHRKAHTYARLGTPLGFVERPHAVACVQVIAGIYRDFGDRTDRQHARLKYVVEEWGIDVFRAEFERRAGFPLLPWVEVGELRHRDWLGAHEQGDGRWLYGIHVENGRVIDTPERRTKTALRELVERLRPKVVLTAEQDLLLADLEADAIPQIEETLSRHGVASVQSLGPVRRNALACPALPTCGLALAESERIASDVVGELDAALARLGLDDTPISVRMTGCPNGCTRPYDADLGIVGRKPGHYDLFLGGGLDGVRLAELHAEGVAQDEIVSTLEPLFSRWARERRDSESLGAYYDRCERGEGRRDILTGAKEAKAKA